VIPSPRRATSGLDSPRIAMILAMLERHGGVRLGKMDIYAATVGGVKLSEPSADLAIALALASSAADTPLPQGLVAIGEVGLAGEVRRVTGVERRLAEAARLGFTHALVPPEPGKAPKGMRVVEVATIGDAMAAIPGRPGRGSRRTPRQGRDTDGAENRRDRVDLTDARQRAVPNYLDIPDSADELMAGWEEIEPD
jgi:DNA repair protein RadA/Sms